MSRDWAKAEKGRLVEDYRPDMPPLKLSEYLIDRLFDVGPVVDIGMGVTPLRSEHLISWQIETGIILQPWEARAIRKLSFEYLAQSQKSTKAGCPPPYGITARRSIVAKKIDEIFG